MKITAVNTYYVRPRWGFVEIETDEGYTGWGEAVLEGHADAVLACVNEYKPYLIGQDPSRIEDLNATIYRAGFYRGGGVLMSALSGIDQALWDIKGKALGVPVYKLLGGKVQPKLRAYASQLQLGWGKVRKPKGAVEEYAEEARKAIADGYDAVKVDVLGFDREGRTLPKLEGPLSHKYIALGEERVRAIREAVGPDVDIIIENHADTDLVSAVQFAKAIEKYNIFFYEEINTPLNPKLLREAKDKIDIPLASGERIYARWGYLPYFENRSIDVIQPDLGSCGGFSEFKKIVDTAHAYEISVQAHVAGTGVAEAASLHAETAIPNFVIHEHHQKTLLPEYQELVKYDYQPKDGYYTVPELPGIGQDITDEVYKQSDYVVVK